MYQLICLTTGEPINGEVYTSATEALDAKTGINTPCRIARVVTNEWAVREYNRLNDGTYRRLPEFLVDFSPPNHYAHVSDKDPTKIAYTQSPEKGMDDVRTVTPVSTYLARFNPSLPPHEVRDLADRYLAYIRGKTNVTIAYTREAFRFAYSNQPVLSPSSNHVSCMANSGRYYTGSDSLHPAEAYSTDENGLYIAYTVSNKDGNVVTARAVVYPKHMLYTKVYALDQSYRTALIEYLDNEGYSESDNFDGAPMSRIDSSTGYVSDKEDGEFLMPYIDGDAQSVDDSPHRKRFFICHHGDYEATGTTGTIKVGDSINRTRCAYCEERCDADDMREVSGELWCGSCTDDAAMFCDHYEEYFNQNTTMFHTVYTARRRGGTFQYFIEETWCEEAVRHNAFKCDRTGRYYSADNCEQMEVITSVDGTTETWCREVDDYYNDEKTTDPLYFECDDCGKIYANTPNLRHHGNICMVCYEAHKDTTYQNVPNYIRDINQIEMAV